MSLSQRKPKSERLSSRASRARRTEGLAVAIEADHAMMHQIGERARRAETGAIIAVRVEADARRADAPRDEPALRRTDHAHRDVGVAARQILVAVGDGELDGDARMSRMKAGEDRGQHLAADDLARRHANHAPIERRFRGGRTGERRGRRRHRFAVRRERERGGRRRQSARRAGEQREAERVFQRVDMTADGRLREPEPSRRAGQAAVAHDFEEGAQFVPGGFSASHTKMYSWSRTICNSAGAFGALHLPLSDGACSRRRRERRVRWLRFSVSTPVLRRPRASRRDGRARSCGSKGPRRSRRRRRSTPMPAFPGRCLRFCFSRLTSPCSAI